MLLIRLNTHAKILFLFTQVLVYASSGLLIEVFQNIALRFTYIRGLILELSQSFPTVEYLFYKDMALYPQNTCVEICQKTSVYKPTNIQMAKT